jgi:hypothetical protein
MIVWLSSTPYESDDTIPVSFCILEITNYGKLFLRISVESGSFIVRTTYGYVSTSFSGAKLGNSVHSFIHCLEWDQWNRMALSITQQFTNLPFITLTVNDTMVFNQFMYYSVFADGTQFNKSHVVTIGHSLAFPQSFRGK